MALYFEKIVVNHKVNNGKFHRYFLMKPWLSFVIVNVVSLMFMVGIAYGICVFISAACNFEFLLFVFFL